jgi:beta-mannanase
MVIGGCSCGLTAHPRLNGVLPNAKISRYTWRKKSQTALSLELQNEMRMKQRTYTRRDVVKGGAAALLGASLALPLISRRAGTPWYLTRGVSVGIYPSGNGPLYGDFAELVAYINLAGGVVPKLVSVFSAWIPEGSTTYLYPHTDDLNLFYNRYPGSVLVWTWEPFGVTLQQIKSGAHDAYIDEVARRIGAVGQRVLIRFAHEMNLRWSWPWLNQPPADYIAAWKRIVSRFRNLGATNAEWVWAPHIIADSADDFSPWYPGDAYVDWTGLDGYNWGSVENVWYTFHEIFQNSIGVITALSPRGIIITETGCHSRGPHNESKGYWYSQMAAELKQNYPQLQGLINSHMIDQRDGEDAEWRVDMPITSLDDWQNLVTDPQFRVPLGQPTTALADNTAPKVTAVGRTTARRESTLPPTSAPPSPRR